MNSFFNGFGLCRLNVLMLQVNREILISFVIIVERQICWIAIGGDQLIPLFLIIGNATAGTIAGF